MSEEIQSMVQILELYGRGLGALGRAIRFSAKGAKHGVDIAKLKRMQHKMKLHYASTGKHNTMKLSDLEKLTGEQYHILNIPLEDEKKLIGFYDKLKQMHVSFAELPDLQMGDGYTQIAYNPMDAEKVRMAVDYYRKNFPSEPWNIDIDKYMEMAGKEGEEFLNELAAKGYTDQMHTEQLQEIKDRVKSQEYLPISLNIESLLIREEKDAYVMRVPKGSLPVVPDYAIRIKKSDCILMDQGQTIITCLKRHDRIDTLPLYDGKLRQSANPTQQNVDRIAPAFSEVSTDRIKEIQKLQDNYTAIFPSFHQGQEVDQTPSVPNHDQTEVPEKDLGQPERTVSNILSYEKMKERVGNPDYIPLTFHMDSDLVAETKQAYITHLPMKEPEQEVPHWMTFRKEDAYLSPDGKRLHAYLKRDDQSVISEFDKNGERVSDVLRKNEDIAREFWRKDMETPKLGTFKSHTKTVPLTPKPKTRI